MRTHNVGLFHSGGVARTSMFLAVALCLMTSALAADSPKYKLVIRPIKQVEIVEAYQSQFAAEVKEWAFLTQKPPITPQQDIKMTVEPGGMDGFTASTEKCPLTFIHKVLAAPKKDLDIEYTVTYRGTMNTVELVPLKDGETPPKVAPLSDSERQRLTASSPCCDYDSAIIKAWIKREGFTRKKDEGEVEFARRVFLALPKSLTYNMNNKTDETRASAVVKAKVGVCEGLSLAYAAALRASGIPARSIGVFQGGMNYKLDEKNGQKVCTDNCEYGHTNNEFYAEGVGWVPVDVTPCLNVNNDDPKQAEVERLKSFGVGGGAMMVRYEQEDFEVDSVTFGHKGLTRSADFRSKYAQKIEDPLRRGKSDAPGTLGLFWTGASADQPQRHWQISVATTPLLPELADPAGKCAEAGMQPGGYRIWTDDTGWHIRTYSGDSKPHKYQFTISAEQGKIASYRVVGKGKDQGPAPQIAEEFTGAKEGGVDFRTDGDVKMLKFDLKVEGIDAKIWTFIGAKMTQPLQVPFLMAVGQDAGKPTPADPDPTPTKKAPRPRPTN